jgi:hypothetical protein
MTANHSPFVPAANSNQILPLTKWVILLIIPFLAIAFVMLYFFPDNTTELFAWTITPRMTPMLMGAGYISGAYFFARAIRASRWHHIAVGFLPVTTFATTMGIATLLHWDRFNHDHISFYAWTILYATTPFIVFGIWWLNRRADSGRPDADDAIVPVPVRWLMGIIGAFILLTGLALFLLPDLMIDLWPWQLSPLTARVGGGWLAMPGVFGILLALDSRWSAARLALQSLALSFVLVLIAVARAWDNFDPSNPTTWFFIGAQAVLLLAIIALYVVMESRRNNRL